MVAGCGDAVVVAAIGCRGLGFSSCFGLWVWQFGILREIQDMCWTGLGQIVAHQSKFRVGGFPEQIEIESIQLLSTT